MSAVASVEEAIAGLRWAFAIWHRAAQANRPIKVDFSYRLLVPAGDTLIPATEAVFGRPGQRNCSASGCTPYSALLRQDVVDFVEFRKRLLAPTTDRAFGRGRTFVGTLIFAGVGRRHRSSSVPVADHACDPRGPGH